MGSWAPPELGATETEIGWERRWAPHDEPTYHAVLGFVQPDDIILDIGAGDLRLAVRLAQKARRVYAIERNPALLPVNGPLPDNVELICADAYECRYPVGITLAVLLMRHCRRFRLLADRLAEGECQRLITNARWGFGVELIDLRAQRQPFSTVPLGWYACWCGTTGFVPGPANRLTPMLESVIHEVVDCPSCRAEADGHP